MSNTKRIMEQAQAFASAWSLVGGAFDGGDGKERAEEEKAELQRMVEELETALNAIPSSDNTIDGLSQYVEKLESHLAALEKQEPVAWLDKSTEERPGDTVWLPCDLKGMDTSWLVPLYAAQPVTAPVRLTDEQLADAACNANNSFRAIESAVLRANGFKIDHPEHALELVGLRGCNSMKKFNLGDLVRKKSGAEFEGRVVGEYSTGLTPEGYAVESIAHKYTVQIYPAAALELIQPSEAGG